MVVSLQHRFWEPWILNTKCVVQFYDELQRFEYEKTIRCRFRFDAAGRVELLERAEGPAVCVAAL